MGPFSFIRKKIKHSYQIKNTALVFSIPVEMFACFNAQRDLKHSFEMIFFVWARNSLREVAAEHNSVSLILHISQKMVTVRITR